MSYPYLKGNFIPKAALMKSGFKTLNTARQNSSRAVVSVNTARPINTAYLRPTVNCARLASNVFNRTHLHVKRPFNKFTTKKNHNFNEKVNIVKGNVTIVGPKAVVSDNKGNKANVVKGNPQQDLKDKGIINSGCSRHMTGNRSNLQIMKILIEDLLPLEEVPKEGKLLGKKNIVLFTDTECVVLSSDFKLTNESHVLLKVPRKDNMYSIDLKNVFLKEKTCLKFLRPFGCPVTIINTIDHLGKFDGKADERFFIGYSTNSKAFRVFNSKTRIVEENLHVKFSEETPNIAENGPNWLFDIDALTKSMNYEPVIAGNQSNGSAGTKACDDVGKDRVEIVPGKDYIMLPLWTQDPSFSSSSKVSPDAGFKPSGGEKKKDVEDPENEDSMVPNTEEPRVNQEQDANVNNTNNINTISSIVNDVSIEDNAADKNIVYGCDDDPNMPNLEEIVYSDDDEGAGAEADMTNLDTHILKVWTLVDLPYGKRAIETKWVYKNKKDERGIVVRNKARLVAQGYTQEEGIDYDEVFAPIARIEAIRMFLAYAPFKDFVVYQMEVKSAFLYGKIEEEVYVCQPSGFEDPEFPDRVYKVEKALYGLHQAPRAWYETLSTYLLDKGFQRGQINKTLFIKRVKGDILLVQKFQMSSMGELTFFLGLQVIQKDDGIFISQDKYVDEILKKFGFSTVKTVSTPIETSKPLMKDENAENVDVYLYRSMIGSLMYLTSLRLDIMFAVCACVRFQVTPKVSHLHAVKRIFRYLKGQPKLGLWYHKDSPFDLEAYTDSDYAGDSLDRKSTTGGCQFLGRRLISWQ
ncbi:putative ribonuclease H-like domain-containing protein [Tanacetum coccineum]